MARDLVSAMAGALVVALFVVSALGHGTGMTTRASFAETARLDAVPLETVPLCPVYVNATGPVALDIHADDTDFHECLLANGDVRVRGDGLRFHAPVKSAGNVTVAGAGNVSFAGGVEASQVWPYVFAYEPDRYAPGGDRAGAASQDGAYRHADHTLRLGDEDVADGVYHVDGNVFLELERPRSHAITIVASGQVEIDLASGVSLQSYQDGLVALSSAPSDTAVRVIATGARVAGTYMALDGTVRLQGQGADVMGILVGDHVRITGSGHAFWPGLGGAEE